MRKTTYVYHNLGLGDHIICNGLIRKLESTGKKIIVFCKDSNSVDVERMYQDNSNIDYMSFFNTDKEVRTFMYYNQDLDFLILRPNKQKNKSFDKATYEMAGIDFNCKWDCFDFKRNIQQEKWLFDDVYKLDVDEDYIFVHDDKTRGYEIKGLSKKLKVVRPDKAFGASILDYMMIIEQAKEVHCIDSCFLNLIDCSQIRNKDLYFHKSVRESNKFVTPELKLNWHEK